jgi:hypothetical protein
MLPIIPGREGDLIKIEVTINLSGSMLEAEESILQGVNAVGTVATGEALKRFDADGDPIMLGGAKWYSKGKMQKIYHTSYGVVSAERHVYQPAEGGKTFCPMDAGALALSVQFRQPSGIRKAVHLSAHCATLKSWRMYMHGRARLTDAEVAEIRRRRRGVRASLACEGMHLTAEEEALFTQMDSERLTPDEAAKRIVEFSRAKRREKALASA